MTIRQWKLDYIKAHLGHARKAWEPMTIGGNGKFDPIQMLGSLLLVVEALVGELEDDR